MTPRERWEAAHQLWVDSWDVISTRVGPCGFGCSLDSRHRVADAWVDRYRGGESVEEIADDYGKDPADVQAVVLLGLAADRLRVEAGLPEDVEPPQPP